MMFLGEIRGVLWWYPNGMALSGGEMEGTAQSGGGVGWSGGWSKGGGVRDRDRIGIG